MATGPFDETVDLAQPKPRSLSWLVSREKWLERMIKDLRGHTGSGIAHADDNILSGGNLRVRTRIVVINRHVCSFDGELSAIRHRIARVDSQVDDSRFQMVHVRFNIPEAGSAYCLNFDPFA